LDSNIAVQYSVGVIITLHGRISAREYVDKLGNQLYPMIQPLFPNNDALFQDTAETVQSWFEERKGELQHLPWPAQSPHLNIIEPLWSVLETILRIRLPSPTSLKQLEDVLQEEWYEIPLQTVQHLYEPIPRTTAAVFKVKDGPTPY
jgi:hypothetical protein